jgi:H+/Cl- antiporter ClcA
MLSAFNTKFKALKSRLPQSSLDSPWRMALFWMVATVVILASFLLMIIWEAFKAMARPNGNSSPVENQQTQAEINAAAFNEGSLLHQHYEMDGTIVRGLKDTE